MPMRAKRDRCRLLIYSHDTFGLGHLRRCRAIANTLVDHREDLSVLILSGSPIIGSFGFRPRVDFVRFPGVVKLRNGSYTAQGLDVSIEHAVHIRESLIYCSAEAYEPDIFLVDKEPLGLRGEVERTLHMLKKQGTRLVLGLRDILDDGEHLAAEWTRKGAMPALEHIYNDIWVYGSKKIYDPLSGLDVPKSVRKKMTYTGYLRKDPEDVTRGGSPRTDDLPDDFILVTTGGGGDGAGLIDWVISAYEADPGIPHTALVVTGPFMPKTEQTSFERRAAKVGPKLKVMSFLADLDRVMPKAKAIIGMGGYNTFCEILSADRPALIVPRTKPRMEQTIRAERMAKAGIVKWLSDEEGRDPMKMARMIRRLPNVPPPSAARDAQGFDGYTNLKAIMDGWLNNGGARVHTGDDAENGNA
jgi:predicted glycosyltransferase